MMICVSPEVFKKLLKRTTAATNVGWGLSAVLNAASAVMAPSKPVFTDCKRNPAGPLNTTATRPSLTWFWGTMSSSTPSPSRSTARGVGSIL